ncbi:exopolysaccharide biosynthesis polyprenyl glycosylphosphotransferase [Negadavirga shengliensis]|uniref:Exopolysaccharide biosynthesis polyprenyl glycosylphosphotransferase n=1 Tax=Negadavirga shengliensis TaxID=1389218 RepID=A0ABV9T823_9BACT
MNYSNSKNTSNLYLVSNTLILIVTLWLSIYLSRTQGLNGPDWELFFGLIGLWALIVFWRRRDYFPSREDFKIRQVNFLKSSSILILVCIIIYIIFSFPAHYRNVLLAFSFGFPLAGMFTNLIIISLISRFKKSRITERPVMLAGGNGSLTRISDFYRNTSGYNVKGFVRYSEKHEGLDNGDAAMDLEKMKDFLHDNDVDEIIVAVDIKKARKLQRILDIADYYGKRVKFVPNYERVVGEPYKAERFGDFTMVNTRHFPLDNRKSFLIKDWFDWFFSGFMLAILSPLFLVIACLIKLESNRPVFYCPIRIGRGGKPFRLYKFCTMNDSDPVRGGVMSTSEEDPRITKLGKFLRRTSIDELPQFINVFFGDMSVVGPRPHRIYLDQQFQQSQSKYMLRHYFKPGITGWAQVNGWRGPTETDEQKRQRTLHDLWYLKNWSLYLDLKIIYLTIFGKKTHTKVF